MHVVSLVWVGLVNEALKKSTLPMQEKSLLIFF